MKPAYTTVAQCNTRLAEILTEEQALLRGCDHEHPVPHGEIGELRAERLELVKRKKELEKQCLDG